jgi:hypothetical protein
MQGAIDEGQDYAPEHFRRTGVQVWGTELDVDEHDSWKKLGGTGKREKMVGLSIYVSD